MAGIGFELRKLFDEDNSFSGYIKAITFSTFISVGPFLSTIIAVNILILVSKLVMKNQEEQLLFVTTLVYGFIFSQLISYPFQFLVTRYISDLFYKKDYKKVRPSFVGVTKLIIILSFIVGILFLKGSDLPLYYKYLSLSTLIILSILWTITTYISVLKDYKYISKIYFYSNLITVIVFLITLKYPILFSKYQMAGNMIFSFLIGIIFGAYKLISYFFSIFRESEGGEYEFIEYFKNYSSLFFIGLFYILGTWSHIVINWYSPWAVDLGHGFITVPYYENAVFYSFLLTIPSIVFFVVFIETRFFDIYQKYYALILKKGTLEDIEIERKIMKKKLYKEIFYALQIQIFITLSMLLFSRYFIIYHEMPVELVNIFKLTSLGAIANAYIIIIISIFFYFNELKKALKVTALFFVLNTVFTLITLNLSKEYLGFSFFLGSVIALLYALQLFDKILENLNYQTFYSQNFALKKRGKLTDFIILKLNYSTRLKWSDRRLLGVLVILIILLIILGYLFLISN